MIILKGIALAVGVCLIPVAIVIAIPDFIYSMKDAMGKT